MIRGGELRDLSLKARHVDGLQLGLYVAPAYLAPRRAVAYPQNRYVSTRLRGLIDWMTDLMKEHAPIEGR